MKKLEALAIIESTGNYNEEEIEDILTIYNIVVKYIGFEDKRRDNRFIVKFHDIFYYEPDEYDDDEFNRLFEDFCNAQYENVTNLLWEKNIDIDEMLHPMYVGNYQAFVVDIPEITSENAADIAMKVYDEFNWEGGMYVKNYVYTVDILQDLEDNYMDYWIEWLELNEIMPEEKIKEIKKKYKEDMERRKAKKTLAK